MSQDRLITVAIHTYEKAVMLKSLLESEGVSVALQNVNLVQPVISSGVRVRIQEKDLPLALRIIENTDIFYRENETTNVSRQQIIVPVDFSDYSMLACTMAFHIAYRHKANIVILHSYINPYISGNIQLSDTLTYDTSESETRKALEATATQQMKEFTSKLKNMIKQGEIPPVKFSIDILEGVPEDVITEYTKEHKPMLLVMGTRAKWKKEKELIGSVTAEVLDSCRFPAFSIPEATTLNSIEAIKHIVFFSNLDQDDILAMDALCRMLPGIHPDVTIINIPDKKQDKSTNNDAINRLLHYCKEHYPDYNFTTELLKLDRVFDDFKQIDNRLPINLIAVPNKKKNIFARLFNPGIAHRMLFHADIPMMVIPV